MGDGTTEQGYRVYTFSTWDKTLTNVQSYLTVHPQYSTVDYYVVIFANYDNTVLLNTYIRSGLTATYSGDMPTRAYDAVNHIMYTFNGWSPNINSAITNKTTFIAQYNNITWYLPELANDILTIRSAYNVTANQDGSITIE